MQYSANPHFPQHNLIYLVHIVLFFRDFAGALLARYEHFCYYSEIDYQIEYFSEEVQQEILALPDTLAARYIFLTRRMEALGPNLGEPHTKAFGQGLFELRLKGAEGIARVFYCTVVGKRIFMLHSFIKKSAKTPQVDLSIATNRMKEVKRENS